MLNPVFEMLLFIAAILGALFVVLAIYVLFFDRTIRFRWTRKGRIEAVEILEEERRARLDALRVALEAQAKEKP